MSLDYVQVPPDSTGKRLKAIYVNYSGQDHYMEVLALVDASGDLVGIGNPLIVTASGDTVSLPSTQAVKVSGETIYVITASGDYVNITGSLTATANISGQWVEAHMLSGDISSNISGQWVETHLLSGEVSIASGVAIDRGILSGLQVITQGDIVVKTSGETTPIASGAIINRDIISGIQVIIQPDIVVKTSGEWNEVHLLSGEASISSGVVVYRELLSGLQVITQPNIVVKTSGETVSVASGVVLDKAPISGLGVTIQPNAVVKISGETVDVAVPTILKTNALKRVTDASGGEVLYSGATKSVTLKNMSEYSGDIYIGGSGDMPYSGFGFALSEGEAINLDVIDFAGVYVVAEVSGELVSFIGNN